MTRFSRDEIDVAIDKQVSEARAEGSSSELLFIIDSPLREYIVSVRQMLHEGGTFSEVADATVTMVVALMFELGRTIKADTNEEYVNFCNVFMHQVAIAVGEAVKDASNVEYEIEELKHDRTEH